MIPPKLRALADLAAEVVLSPTQLLAKGYREYSRYRLTLKGADGTSVEQTRDVIAGGKVVAVLPVDLGRDEIVLIRQFRLPAHLANGKGDLVEIVAGRVESNEAPRDAALRECSEEIGTAPTKLVELFSYLTTPGITDEEVIVFLAAVDATRVPDRAGAAGEGEQIVTIRATVDQVLAALARNEMHNGPLLIALQWLALNRARLRELLG